MTGQPILRTVAVAASAALLLSALAGPVSGAKPKCAGKVATIVGTAKGEVIVGTKKNDVIVAKGGHDIVRGRGGNDTICGNKGNDKLVGGGGNDFMLGQTGRDKLFGGPGRDRLLGGPADDRFNGGTGNDACLQGTGSGPRLNCERPALAPVPLPVAPPPPPPAPTLIPLTGILVVAYSDIDGLDGYSTGDVLISKLVDKDGDRWPSKDDTIVMGQYPTRLDASLFGDWTQTSHSVTVVSTANATTLDVDTPSGNHVWSVTSNAEYYLEQTTPPNWAVAVVVDGTGAGAMDEIQVASGSPSQPKTGASDLDTDPDDDHFIDVELHYGGSIL